MSVSPLKKKLLDRKIGRPRQEVRDLIGRNPGGTESMFPTFRNKPSASDLEEMVIASKYGPGNPLWVNPRFGLEYLDGEYREMLSYARKNLANNPSFQRLDDQPRSGFIPTSKGITEFWGNLIVAFLWDAALVPFLPEDLSFEEFEDHPELEFALDKESGTIGSTLSSESMVSLVSATRRSVPLILNVEDFQPSPFKSNEHATVYHVVFGAADRMKELFTPTEKRGQHEVAGHFRNLRSGRVVQVRDHRRTNPLMMQSRKRNFSDVSYLVYRAYDADGVLRYIGEGTESRPAHVNSGTSHNYKLNEHFFMRGAMRVEIVSTGLSKGEALAVEQLLIRESAGAELWNIRDNEFMDLSGTDCEPTP